MQQLHDWETYFARIGDHLAVIRVDLRAGMELPELDAPNLLHVQYLLQQPDADGLPGDRDARTIDTLRAELLEWFAALGGRLVGEISAAAQHGWFIYVPCGWLEAANLVHRIGLRCNATLGARMLADATHNVYHEVLLPEPDELRRTHNAEKLAALQAMGDDATQPRPILHEIRFDNRVQALACAQWGRSHGFAVDSLLPPARQGDTYHLTLRRLMPLDIHLLDEDTRQLDELARRLGGDYVDWRAELRQQQTA